MYIENLANSLSERDSLIVCGDFILPNLDWIKDIDSRILFPATVLSTEESTTVDGMLSANLMQINFVKNSNGKLLDLIFSNDLENVYLSSFL